MHLWLVPSPCREVKRDEVGLATLFCENLTKTETTENRFTESTTERANDVA